MYNAEQDKMGHIRTFIKPQWKRGWRRESSKIGFSDISGVLQTLARALQVLKKTN